ncbi:hypothetical protein T492DRAFT_996323 [Pavlovales sp. CCMP2436]|nr:hypothetical protein T492DRAFT_996323 [Pavlovales sp. CCMP2436]
MATRVPHTARTARGQASRKARWRTARGGAAAILCIALARGCWLAAGLLSEFRGSPAAVAVNSSVVARDLVTRRTTAATIVEQHGRYFRNTNLKMTATTAIAILAGSVSWRESFALVSRNRAKFTHVAPAWFVVSANGRVTSSEWWPVRALVAFSLRLPPARLFTPLVSFKDFDLPADNSTHPELAARLAVSVAGSCGSSSCDGLLVDIHLALRRQADARPFANAFVRALSARLRGGRAGGRQLLLLVPAYSDAFGVADVRELLEHVDAFIVQTFGFSSKVPGPSAPLPWMQHALTGLLPAESASVSGQKLVAMVRLGGNDFRASGGGPLCNRTRYLELLRLHSPRLDWYAEASEHVFAYTDQRNASHSVYHPTLKSLHDRLTAIRSWGVGVAVDEIHCGLDYMFDLL